MKQSNCRSDAMPLEINTQECDRCGTCISVCPCDALVLTDRLDVVVQRCTSCGTCAAICPVGALALDK